MLQSERGREEISKKYRLSLPTCWCRIREPTKSKGQVGENQVSNRDDPKKSGRALKIYYTGQLHKSIELSSLHVSGRFLDCPGCSMPAHTYWHSRPAVLGGDSLPFLMKLLLFLWSWIFNSSLNRSCGALKWLIRSPQVLSMFQNLPLLCTQWDGMGGSSHIALLFSLYGHIDGYPCSHLPVW